jgi:hypothetical protein
MAQPSPLATTRESHDPMEAQKITAKNKLLNQTKASSSSSRPSRPPPLSRSKFKKKSYLLLQDVATCLQRNEHPKALRKAKEMVQRIDRMSLLLNNEEWTRATRLQAHNLWMHVIAKQQPQSNQKLGPQAETILRQLQSSSTLDPNLVSYATVMDAYAQDAKNDPESPKHVERIFFEWLDVIDHQVSVTFRNQVVDGQLASVASDTVLHAWVNQGTVEGAQRALELLQRLETISQSRASKAWCRPTLYSYATVVHGLATCQGGVGAAKQASDIVNRLLNNDKTLRVVPDVILYNAVMHAWANSDDETAGQEAMSWLTQMKINGQYPDVISYNTVLSAWSHSGHVNAGPQTEKILKDMMAAHEKKPESAPAPNSVSYNNILHAWSKSTLEGAVTRAEMVLRYMIKTGKKEIRPDVYSFTSVLNALAKSKEANKAVRSQALLTEMLDLYATTKDPNLRPSHIPFNTVLNAAAFSALQTSEQEQREALKVAVQTFKRMRDELIEPDTVAYGNLLKCFANLMPAGQARTDFALQLFDRCCEKGLVGEFVWNEVRRAVPPNLLVDRVKLRVRKPLSAVKVTELPLQWRQHVRRKSNASNRATVWQEASAIRQPPVMRRPRTISEASYQSGPDVWNG